MSNQIPQNWYNTTFAPVSTYVKNPMPINPPKLNKNQPKRKIQQQNPNIHTYSNISGYGRRCVNTIKNDRFVSFPPNRAGKSADIDNMTPKAQEALFEIIKYAKSKGLRVQILQGKRTREEQEYQYKYNPNATSPDKSHHVIGDAVDIKFIDKNGNRASHKVYADIGHYAETYLGMRWGGSCKKHTEEWHFDFGKNKNDVFEL